MKESNISFIGGGNMACSLIGGLISGGCDPARIGVSDPHLDKLHVLEQNFGVYTTISNNENVERADVVVLAVKPQVMKSVATSIAPVILARKSLVISIAAGIRLAALETWLGTETAIVRTMPNTPALVQCGATALFPNGRVSDADRDLAESILRASGLTIWLENETQMDAVTALSGSGPAYFFLTMEALEHAGTSMGLKRETARLLTLQTAFGAAKMALESEEDAADLRARVTSPGGTTERAIEVLGQGGLLELYARALEAARRRAAEIADTLGES